MTARSRKKVVAYVRCSTAEQSNSKLGLDAQRQAIREYAEREGYEVVHWAEEVASGKGHRLDHRPVLRASLERARKERATLLVARLDRLSRDVAFIANLMAEKVPFEVSELGPDIEPMMIYFHAIVSQRERELISKRTRDGIAQAKRRGRQPGHVSTLSQVANEARRSDAAVEADVYRDVLEELSGHSRREIARELNRRRIRSPSGAQWTHRNVGRMLVIAHMEPFGDRRIGATR